MFSHQLDFELAHFINYVADIEYEQNYSIQDVVGALTQVRDRAIALRQSLIIDMGDSPRVDPIAFTRVETASYKEFPTEIIRLVLQYFAKGELCHIIRVNSSWSLVSSEKIWNRIKITNRTELTAMLIAFRSYSSYKAKHPSWHPVTPINRLLVQGVDFNLFDHLFDQERSLLLLNYSDFYL